MEFNMRKDFGEKTAIYPMPVLIIGTFDENNVPNAMNAAWGGVYDTGEIMICLAGDHKTTENIKKTSAFTVSFATVETVAACDYVGIVSANDEPDKFNKAGFHAVPSNHVNAPIIKELPVCVECKLKKFNEDGICIGAIVNMSADESVLDNDGNIDMSKFAPIAFDGMANVYRKVGGSVGDAFAVGKDIMNADKR